MSRFYVSWFGNKRLELARLNHIDFSKYNTIIEPFAGSCALSLSLHASGCKAQFVVNDTDPGLVALWNHAAANGTEQLYADALAMGKEKFLETGRKKDTTVLEWFYVRKAQTRFGSGTTPARWPSFTRPPHMDTTDTFFRSAVRTCEDWRACVRRHKFNSHALIFLDPPYFSSFNQKYYSHDGVPQTDARGDILDVTTLFVEMRNLLRDARCRVVCITSTNALLDEIYRPFTVSRYSKKYSSPVKIGNAVVRRGTTHVVLDNRKEPPPDITWTLEELQALGL